MLLHLLTFIVNAVGGVLTIRIKGYTVSVNVTNTHSVQRHRSKKEKKKLLDDF
jgi:hypothetical protein